MLARQRLLPGQKGGECVGPNPTDRGEPGSKRHVPVDANGIPLALLLSAANVHDCRLLEPLLDAAPPIRQCAGRPRERPGKSHADKGYDDDRCRRAARRRGVKPRIARRGIEGSERLGRHRRAIERALAWFARSRRLTIRHERRPGILLACHLLAASLICLGFVKRRSCRRGRSRSPGGRTVAAPHGQGHSAGQITPGGGAMQVRAIVLAAALVLAPLGTRAADLVVWWEKGFNQEEDQAVREIVAAFEQKTGKQVELVQYSRNDIVAKTQAKLDIGDPPDFLFGTETDYQHGQWAYEGRLADLGDTLGPLASLFEREALDRATLLDATIGQRSLHALPMGRSTFHVHVWKSLLERAGFTLADIPREWEAFWSFWCDTVQPAAREATGRDDVWGIGVPTSASSVDTLAGFAQFMAAHEADYVTRDGRLVIDEPLVQERLAKVLASYTALWRKGCIPPDAIDWDGGGNNEAFVKQRVVMVGNGSLSIPRALMPARPEDYYKNAVTIEWPNGAYGQPLAIRNSFWEAVVFKAGGHTAVAKEFVRFLVEDGWLAHWLDFAGDRLLPPMPALLERPFWLDAGDPHRQAAAIQFLTRPRDYFEAYDAVSGEWRHRKVLAERVWAKAVRRIVADGLSPEQAVDEAITRVKQILGE